ncbi:hypothetical protein AC1031_018243 [Aphanomyces cochlioides]|nr:hypothetical protein AC1031_018243 [Aphanomyces cochlioides]
MSGRFDAHGKYIEEESEEGMLGRHKVQLSPLLNRPVDDVVKLPTLEVLLSVPSEFVIRYIRHPAEAQTLLQVGYLGAELDVLLEHTMEQAGDYHRCHTILKGTVECSLSNSLYVAESVTRHTAMAGIEANLALLDARVKGVLKQLDVLQSALKGYLAMHLTFVQELALGGASALAKSRSQVIQVEQLVVDRVASILTGDMTKWNPCECWPEFVSSRDSQMTHISETEHKGDIQSSASSSVYAGLHHQDEPVFHDNPVVQ